MITSAVSKRSVAAASANPRTEATAPSAQQSAPSVVKSLGNTNVEYFACNYIVQHLQKLEAGAKVLILSDGAESKNAGNFALYYPQLDIYSTEYNFPPKLERVNCWGIGYNRIKIDNRFPLRASLFGVPEIKFEAIMMIKGLCDHYTWQDAQGKDAGPVGCAGIQLNVSGIASFLVNLVPLLAKNGRFALHEDINFIDHQAQHQALSSRVQSDIIHGVEEFNIACVKQMANIHTGKTGLVIAGENTVPQEKKMDSSLKNLAKKHYLKKGLITCGTYTKESP